MNTEFKAGDKVRCTAPTHNSSLKRGEIYTVSHMDKGYVHLVGPATGGWWVGRFELVPEEEPKSAEKGLFLVALMGTKGKPFLSFDTPSFTYWPDAEQFAERRLEANPDCAFGVFKLLGTVGMKPKWTDPNG